MAYRKTPLQKDTEGDKKMGLAGTIAKTFLKTGLKAGVFTAKTMGGVVKDAAKDSPRLGKMAIGAAAWAKANPRKTTGIALAGYAIANYGSSAQQSIPAGNATMEEMPNAIGSNQYGSNSQYDLGGRGDLVLAMRRNQR